MERLRGLSCESIAASLYAGRAIRLGCAAAARIAAPLFVMSAGLGIVGADTPVPAYGLTVASRGPEAVAARCDGPFDPEAWWRAVSAGPLSRPLADVYGGGTGLVLLALTHPYAAMVGPSLSQMSLEDIRRTRLFGWKLRTVLAPPLHSSIMDYDDRLEAILPGTRSDFAQRALTHFGRRILPNGSHDAMDDAAAVELALSQCMPPARPRRPRATDAAILAWLGGSVGDGAGVARSLKRIREDGIACEQSRFARLFRQAQSPGEGI